jgi:Thioredoxin
VRRFDAQRAYPGAPGGGTGVDLRFFPRALSPELEAYYRARDITHIPVFTFLDANFHPLATWVERPRQAHERLAAWYAAHPEVTAVRNDASLDPETRRERLRALTGRLLDEMESWYDHEGIQQATVDEITRLLHPEKL